MKILLSYASEYDKGEGVHFGRVLRRLGHATVEVNVASTARNSAVPGRVVRGYPHGVFLDEVLADAGGADLYLYIEPLGLLPRGLERSPITTACVISDVHRNLSARLALARLFDQVFLYQRDYVRRFADRPTGTVHWLPYACDTEVVRDLGVERDLDVAFIGQVHERTTRRREILEELDRRYRTNPRRYYVQSEIPEVYSRAKIVVDLPVGGDLNFRFFEAMSCGALLLTERLANGQEELFREGTHFAAYGSRSELLEKVDHYLRNQTERLAIAAAGHREVKLHHTLEHRVERLLSTVRDGSMAAPVRAMPPARVSALYALMYERSGAVETLLRLAAEASGPLARVALLARGVKAFARRALLGW